VATEAFEHTSALPFLERFTGVAEPNITDWRRETFGGSSPRPPLLPDDTAEQVERAKEEVVTLPKPTLPGRRPHV